MQASKVLEVLSDAISHIDKTSRTDPKIPGVPTTKLILKLKNDEEINDAFEELNTIKLIWDKYVIEYDLYDTPIKADSNSRYKSSEELYNCYENNLKTLERLLENVQEEKRARTRGAGASTRF